MTEHYPGSSIHQIAPYVGKLRPALARKLLDSFSSPGDVVWDPFSGSGTIPLEATLLGRHVVAADVNPYAVLLTKGKVEAPVEKDIPLRQLSEAIPDIQSNDSKSRGDVPAWVKAFFHPRTLCEAMALTSEFLRKRQYFVAACLLGILHHQRPGFLSFPASHLAPYLRNRLYPRKKYPSLYSYRDPVSRLRSKIERVLAYPPPTKCTRVRVLTKSVMSRYLPDDYADAVITSPPYMNTLDYARDNRLRLWFLGVQDYRTTRAREIRKIGTFRPDMLLGMRNIACSVKVGGPVVLILAGATRGSRTYDVPGMIRQLVQTDVPELRLESAWVEDPSLQNTAVEDVNHARLETVLVFKRVRTSHHQNRGD